MKYVEDKLNRHAITHDPEGILKEFLENAKAAEVRVLSDEEREIDRKDFLSKLSSQEEKANIIAKCEGQLGTNKDYFLNLHQALKQLGIQDTWIEELAKTLQMHFL